MNKPFSLLRPWLVPAALVVVAVVLTVPWSYLVLKAAYDRDVTDNARALARRVEQQYTATYADANNPFDRFFPMREIARRKQMVDTLSAEIHSDATVQTLIFYDVIFDKYPERDPETPLMNLYVVVRKADSQIKPLGVPDVMALKARGTAHVTNDETLRFWIPWMQDSKIVGVTYIELSRRALAIDFRKREFTLLCQVIAWTSTGILALSAVGIFAYRAWRRATHVQQRSELAQQGLLAERGLTAAVLAHEIRNPLQALRFQLHSLRKNSDDPNRVAGTAETIDSELSRIQQLVTDYLEHERAASLRVQSVNLQEAAFKLKTLMDELLRDSDTKLNIVNPPAPVAVTCDPHALRQILMNLVLNAQQAMGTGGTITLRVAREDPFGTIDLTDTGPGIPPEKLARIFKPFQSTKKEGHGIGLALVKRFVDNFGGSVTVDSEPGRGTTFHLKLPLAEHDVTHVENEPLKEQQETQKIDV